MNTFKRLTVAFVATLSLLGLVVSPASAAAFNADEAAYVTDWYDGADLNADASGVAYWANRFDGHNNLSCNSNGSPNYNSANKAAVAQDLKAFLAGTGRMNSSSFWKVYYAYRVVLDRYPDSGGQNYWIGQMDAGVSWYTMVDSMVYSAEYKSNFIQGGRFEYIC